MLNIQVPQNAALTQEAQGREARAAEGGAFRVCATNLTIEQGGKVFDSQSFRLVDFKGQDVCVDVSSGGTLDTLLQAIASSDLNFNAPFTLRYTNQAVITIPEPPLQLNVSPETVSFSNIPVGSSEDKTFTVTNTGGGTLIGGMTLSASDSGGNVFSLVSGETINLGASQSQTVTVRYSPVSTAAVTGSVRITTNGGVKSVLLKTGTGPQLSVSPTSVDFGSVQPQGNVDRTFTVTNTGQGTLTGSASTTAPFSIVSGGSFSLAANQSQAVTVRFSPTTSGAATGSVSVTSNSGSTSVGLTGTGGGTPTPPNQLTHLPFDDGTNPTKDVVGGHDGTIIGAVFTTTDIAPSSGNASALIFNGAGNYVEVADANAFDFGQTSSFSFSLWLKQTKFSSIYHVFGKRAGCGGGNIGINYQMARDGSGFAFGSDSNAIRMGTDLPLNTWTHVAVTYDRAGRVKGYINGNEVARKDDLVITQQNSAPLRIATSGTCPASQTFPGIIDEVRVYTRALTPQEVAMLAAGK